MMKHFPNKYVTLLLGLLTLVMVIGFHVGHASAASPGIDYTIVLNGTTYEVYMRPDFAPAVNMQTLTTQVTVKVPHNAASPFTVNNLFNPISGVTWGLSSRIDAPTED